MYQTGEPRGAALWAWWAAMTALGWAAAGVLFGLIAPRGQGADLLQYAFLPLSAVGQWWLLRHHFGRAGWWLVATAGGCAAAALSLAVLEALPESLAGPPDSSLRAGLSLVTDGLSLGVAQWLVLRGNVRGAARWIGAVGAPLWLYGVPLLQRGFESMPATELGETADYVGTVATTFAVFGLLIGALSGAVLAWMVNQPRVWEEKVM